MKSKDVYKLKKLVGRNLAFHRKKKGLSQYALAKISGINQSNLSKFETGETEVNLWSFYNLSQILGVSMDTLFSDNTENTSLQNVNAMLSGKPDEDIKSIEKIVKDILEVFEKR